MTGGAEARLAEAWTRSTRVQGRAVGGEYVLVPFDDGGADLDAVMRLNAVAAFVWQLLDGTRRGGEVVAAVLERFDVERARAEHDYLELVDTLARRGALDKRG